MPRLGERTFEQAAGFLRIQNGSEPLDASAVHPESYPLVSKIVEAKATTVKDIIGNTEIIRQVNPEEFVDDKFGLPTIQDVLSELENRVVIRVQNSVPPSSVMILLKLHN